MNIKINNYPFGPFPMMVIGSMVDERPNFMAAGAGGCVCHKPMWEVSLNNAHYSTHGILKSGYFSINIPSADLMEKVDYCGLVSGKDKDKSEVFTPFYDELGYAPMAKECAVSHLCKVAKTVEINGFTVFFGDLLATYANEKCLRDGELVPEKVNPLFLMGTNYCQLDCVIGKAFSNGKNINE